MDPQNRLSSSAPPQTLPPALPPAQLPAVPSLEHLKKQARDLLAAARSGDPEATQRLQRWFPDGGDGCFKLTQAQLAIAREYGTPSWAQLKQAVLTRLVERLAINHWSEWRVAHAARDALSRMGEEGMLAALEGLSHPNSRVRRGVADFLDHYADDRCVARLAEVILHDPVPYVRRMALHALECQRCKPAPLTVDVSDLKARVALEDPSPHVRFHALGGAKTAALVQVARSDTSPRVRARALDVLGGRRGEPAAQETLEQALHDARPDVRGAAHKALRRLSPAYREAAAQRAREANLARVAARSPVAAE